MKNPNGLSRITFKLPRASLMRIQRERKLSPAVYVLNVLVEIWNMPGTREGSS
jgi:hypothetical protein